MNSKILWARLPTLTELIDQNHAFESLVSLGCAIDPENLILAYGSGVFPWPHDGRSDLWFSPVERGVIDFREFHTPRSLRKMEKKNEYKFFVNKAFHDVIHHCAQIPRAGSKGTWITPEIISGYVELHRRGLAHSVEAWRDSVLVAGIYGVCIGGNFSAESMFGLEANSSKLCLIKLIGLLEQQGFEFLDVQMVTPVTGSLGGKYISRGDFLDRLLRLSAQPPRLFMPPLDDLKGN